MVLVNATKLNVVVELGLSGSGPIMVGSGISGNEELPVLTGNGSNGGYVVDVEGIEGMPVESVLVES
jgi:hypothetical protein